MTSRDFPEEIVDESSKRNELRLQNTRRDGFKLNLGECSDLSERRRPLELPVYGQELAHRGPRKRVNFSLNSKMADPDRANQDPSCRGGFTCCNHIIREHGKFGIRLSFAIVHCRFNNFLFEDFYYTI